jgi:molybdopterin molybdotransferase
MHSGSAALTRSKVLTRHQNAISLSEAEARVDAAVEGLLAGKSPVAHLGSEQVASNAALGRVVAVEQRSRLDVPPFDRASMDGYAIADGDDAGRYEVIETIGAGQVATLPLRAGTAIRIMTGAPVPAGAGRIVMLEHAEERGGTVVVTEDDRRRNISPRGQDLRAGATLCPAGTELSAPWIGALIASALSEVAVLRRLRLAIIDTGDELVDHAERLAPGLIMNSNGPMLAALAVAHGFAVIFQRTVRDDPKLLAQAVASALATADFVVLSGGVSVGDHDYVASALASCDLQLSFTRVAIKPGKPATLALGHGKLVFALPGNPLAAFVGFHLFVLRAARRLMGVRAASRRRLSLARSYRREQAERLEFVPCSLDEGGRLVPIEAHGSAHLHALCQADGLAIIPAGCVALEAGAEVSVLWLARS